MFRRKPPPSALRIAALDAVHACLPVLPLVGSPKRGYVVARGAGGTRRDEAAAEAVAALYRIAKESS